MQRTLKTAKNPVWANSQHTAINLLVVFEELFLMGELPFTATLSDSEAHSQDIFVRASQEEFGTVQEYQEPILSVNDQAFIARNKRNELLRLSDWTQAADIPQSLQIAWAPYRQALRDVPQQPGFPTNITWPTPPN